jgi:sec-independent protein translocase protein TatC
MVAMKRAKRAKTQNRSHTHKPEAQRLPFIEHLYELRKRLFYVAVSVAAFSLLAYSIERSIVAWLLKPAGGQHFIYTSPIGGLDFLFRVCLYIGVAASIPVIVYQFLRYVEPLLQESSVRFITMGSVISGFLALVGIIFGYSVGLPAALHFLLHQFVSKQVQPLITIQSYMSFVAVYMFGSALLFQVPLILIFINRIKPLNPRKLFALKFQRWVIVGAFIGGGIMNPNPNLLDQIVIVGPLIVMYEVGVTIIWFSQRRHRKPPFVSELLKHDSDLQSVRQERFQAARQAWQQQQAISRPKPQATAQLQSPSPSVVTPTLTPSPTVTTRPTASRPARPVVRRRYVNDFGPARSYPSFNQRVSPDAA